MVNRKWAVEPEDEDGCIPLGAVDSVRLFIYAVWQYSEEVIAEGSRSILLKNAVMLMGS